MDRVAVTTHYHGVLHTHASAGTLVACDIMNCPMMPELGGASERVEGADLQNTYTYT